MSTARIRPSAFSVIIPAYNEARTIGPCLERILATMPDGAAEIIVVPNGCTDDTAAVARSLGTGIRVIELAEGSKSAALNAGNQAATAAPRLFLDADIAADFALLAALADTLRQRGVMAASPAAHIDTAAADLLVRAYYRVWSRHRYLEQGVGGSGIYGLSAEGLARLGEFPPIIADDGYIRALFAPAEQQRVTSITTTVRPPRHVRELIINEARWRAGDRQVRALLGDLANRESLTGNARALAKSRAAGTDLLVYYAIKIAGRILHGIYRLTQRDQLWHRDHSSRL